MVVAVVIIALEESVGIRGREPFVLILKLEPRRINTTVRSRNCSSGGSITLLTENWSLICCLERDRKNTNKKNLSFCFVMATLTNFFCGATG